ncbi:hypothetical protein LY90DRAFT_514377 [Neocallimastix californiae]|uniref:Zn(2)-C6 fungal-type domain-containing protein n=1 Tax=Neocallimastix californiae TaxID=1754190 RepID=A0A1Y2ARR4_9FUNG|nr:hypothetical protein LY90DRAFT_514377 [Neocallimastix californiae]|eukprot:ORY24907.1 hypothetical protein LY90DRAFT_514377 [Neocallimastix californiae]
MNKKLEPPQKTLGEVRIKKDTAPGKLIHIEDLDYILDNLIQNKKKKSSIIKTSSVDSANVESSSQNSTSLTITNDTNTTNTTTSSTIKNNSSATVEIDSKVTSVPESKNDIDKKNISKDTTNSKDSTINDVKTTIDKSKQSDNNNNDKKRLNTKEEQTDKDNKKIKVEEKKTETKKPKRKKVFQACVVCRKSHISCDNKRPCTRCVKKGIAHLCHDAPKKGSNMMDCNSCPIFPLLKGPYPFQTNFYKPPPFPNYSTSILNSQLNPSPLTNFPIPLLNHQKLTYPPPIPHSPYPGMNASNVLVQQSQFLQKTDQQLTQSPQTLQSSLQTLKQAIQNQQDLQFPHSATPSPYLNQQLTPPLTTTLNTMTTNTINNTTIASAFPLTSDNVNTINNGLSLPISNNITNIGIVQQQSSTQPSLPQGSLHASPLVTLPASIMPNAIVNPTLQKNIQVLQSTQPISSPIVNNSLTTSSQELPLSTAIMNTSFSEMNSNNPSNISGILLAVESPNYALPNLEINPSKPCVPFSSVTPIFNSDYMNNEFSALVNFCQNVSNENDMPSQCKNCPFSHTEQFFLKAADNSNLNASIEDQLVDIIKEKYKAGLLKPYNYSKGYLRLQKFLDENISIVNKQKILNAFNTFQKGFKTAATNITDWDLLSSEESFERLLLEYSHVFASVGIPSCLWRRTGEIFKANRHFAYLVGVPVEELNEGKMSIYEFMTEDFVANYWEKYSLIAFDTKQKAVITSCVLENPQSFKRSIKCAFSFTVRRDKFDIPSAIIGNFMPYNPQLIYKDPFSTRGLGILGFLSPYSTPSYSPFPRGEIGYKGCGCTNTQCCTPKLNTSSILKSFSIINDTNNQSTCPRDSQGNVLCGQCGMNGSCPRKLTITSCSNHCSCGGGDCESNTDNLSIKATSNSQNDMDISTNISTTQDTLITNDPVMNEFMNIDMGSNYLNHSNSNPTLSTTTAAFNI